MQKDTPEIDYRVKLSQLLEENMTVFPVVARKVMIATNARTSALSSDLQFFLLESLRQGPTRPTEISRVLGVSKPNVTTLINTLIVNGLAQRSHDEKDRRNVYITMTNKGKRVLQRRRKTVKNYMLALFDKFDDNDIRAFCVVMERFTDMMRKMDKAIGPVV